MNRCNQWLALAAAVVVAAACTSSGAQPIASLASPEATTASDSTDSLPCHVVSIAGQREPRTLERVHKDGRDAVIGVFGGYGDARWNTPEGERPTTKQLQESVVLLRPLAIDLESRARGTEAAVNRAVARGGTLGCDSMTFTTEPILVEGQRYLFFFTPLLDLEEKPSGDFLVSDAWPVGKDDMVQTEQDGALLLPDVVDALLHGPKASAPPSPGEPPDAPP